MLWLKLGWRNLWRTPRRTAIELASIAGAVFLCMFMVCMQAGMYPKMIEEGTRMGSGHVGFYREGYLDLRQVSLTFPVTKLFEFDLAGTLDEPKWEPRNLPKELFLIFE